MHLIFMPNYNIENPVPIGAYLHREPDQQPTTMDLVYAQIQQTLAAEASKPTDRSMKLTYLPRVKYLIDSEGRFDRLIKEERELKRMFPRRRKNGLEHPLTSHATGTALQITKKDGSIVIGSAAGYIGDALHLLTDVRTPASNYTRIGQISILSRFPNKLPKDLTTLNSQVKERLEMLLDAAMQGNDLRPIFKRYATAY